LTRVLTIEAAALLPMVLDHPARPAAHIETAMTLTLQREIRQYAHGKPLGNVRRPRRSPRPWAKRRPTVACAGRRGNSESVRRIR
jgi:hypothetical protein